MTEWMVNGWRDHDGSGMPVDPDVMVLVRFRDGGETEIPSRRLNGAAQD